MGDISLGIFLSLALMVSNSNIFFSYPLIIIVLVQVVFMFSIFILFKLGKDYDAAVMVGGSWSGRNTMRWLI